MQNININTCEGIRLAALLSIPDNAAGLIIACHGFRGGKENGGRIYHLAEELSRHKMGLLAFDFQGSGQSEGEYKTITLTRQARDLNDAIQFARKNLQLPIYLLGRSFGGSTVLAGGSVDPDISGYIFWCTPIYLRETFAGIMETAAQEMEQGNTVTLIDDWGNSFELAPDLFNDFQKHNMDYYLACIGNRPVLIVQGQADEVVSPDNARYIADKLPQAVLHIVEGADHRFTAHTPQRDALTLEWLLNVI